MENLKPLPLSQGDIFVIELTLTEDLRLGFISSCEERERQNVTKVCCAK